jgi:predicted nucleic acid-binding protein
VKNVMKSAFVDTNILVYAASGAGRDVRKKRIAREIILLPRLHVSVQVLNEFIAVARNPNKLNFSRDQEAKWLREWFELKINALTFTTFQKALELHMTFQLSHWDSLIIASARESACPIVYSEDMNHGQNYDGVKVINPFL